MTKLYNLEKHLREEHRMSPFSTYLKEIVYGGNDGIITTFAVVAGFSGANAQLGSELPLYVVLLFGFANLFADGVSMALGNLLSSRSEQDVYKKFKTKEHSEIRSNPEMEKAESIEILLRKGFSKSQAETLVTIYSTNSKYWLEFMMEKELRLPNPEGDKPLFMALATFFSFVTFGFIPLLPYIFLPNNSNHFLNSVTATLMALMLLGVLRWKISQHKWYRSIGETLVLGGSAATVAFFVGSWFRV